MEAVNDFVWGVPALAGILSVGIFLTWRLRLVQFRLLPQALKAFWGQLLPGRQTHSSCRALCTALAATVGTGNLVGVAGAICLGGPGAIFWMWVCGFLGMATKYAEAVLAVRYRVKTRDGFAGGPMYIITLGLPKAFHGLAWLYALFGAAASFGVGNVTQINAAVTGIREAVCAFGWEPGAGFALALAVFFGAVVGLCVFGGAGRIASAAEGLVPLAAALYLVLCLLALCLRWQTVPQAFFQILQGAFSPRAATGGLLGSCFAALRTGCSRGVFTNEAGMGTAAIAHAQAEAVHPVQQGMMGLVEVFLDTEVICTLTALVILTSGAAVPYGRDAGAALTSRAFACIFGPGAAVWLAAAMSLFALAAVLGWGLYGGRCAEYLFGKKAWKVFSGLQVGAVFAGSCLQTSVVWQLAQTLNGLMAIPNLIMLAALTAEVVRLTKDYKTGKAGGGNYANFHQCQPL